jgi:hypothetical protein
VLTSDRKRLQKSSLKCLVQVTCHSGEPFLGDEELPFILDFVYLCSNSGPMGYLAVQSFRNNLSSVFSVAGFPVRHFRQPNVAFHFEAFFRWTFGSFSGLCGIGLITRILNVTCFSTKKCDHYWG